MYLISVTGDDPTRAAPTHLSAHPVLWADAPAAIVVPVALLIILDIRIRLWRQHT